MGKLPRIGILKIGCIASSPLLEYTLDERAERQIEVTTWSTGAKMDASSCHRVLKEAISYSPDLILVVSPNASLEGPTAVREAISKTEIPTISISDSPSKKAFIQKGKDGPVVDIPSCQGFIIVTSDPMIGARREFLDSTEMVLFNADAMRVLAVCGVVRGLHTEIDKVADAISQGKEIVLPRIIMDAGRSLEYAKFSNPYAKAKAYAALTIAEDVARVTSLACFRTSDSKEYVHLAASGHEMMRAAARLADEAREVEKYNDGLYRSPHAPDGRNLEKTRLGDKPA